MTTQTNNGSPSGPAENSSSTSGSSASLEAGLFFVRSQRLSEVSRTAREKTWCRFVSRLEENGTPLVQAAPVDLANCAAEHRSGRRPKKHAERVLRLAEQVVYGMQCSGSLPSGRNSASVALAGIAVRLKDDPPVFPDPGTLPHLKTFLKSKADEDYLRRRDKALFALALGAGAPPTALGLMGISCVESALASGIIVLKNSGPTVKRPSSWEAPLFPWARTALERWLEVCGASSSDLAFPGRFGEGLSRSRIFRGIRALLLEVSPGSTKQRLCPQTLRNGYFALLVESGQKKNGIFRAMGWSLSDGEQYRCLKAAWNCKVRNDSLTASSHPQNIQFNPDLKCPEMLEVP